MRSFVVATSGHVDHGKSTLVRALTGIEPDRLAEERRRGLTIDLGFAWRALPSGARVAFVDVPGHERFLGNMLAGLAPTSAVLFVVAADQGWQQQSEEHLLAALALGIHCGVIAITRCDLAPDAVVTVRESVHARLAGTALAAAPIVEVVAPTGQGLPALLTALDDVLTSLPAPDDDAAVRLWLDRSFSVQGAGTVVTGTLAQGAVAPGDAFAVCGAHPRDRVEVRSVQSRGVGEDRVGSANRVALNLRGVTATEVQRGDALVTPGAWWEATMIDVRRLTGGPFDESPTGLIAHLGTAAVPVRLRPFDGDHARLHLDRPLPLRLGDRLVLRAPGAHPGIGGVVVLDVDPPPLHRRGAGARRAATLAAMPAEGSLTGELERRGPLPEAQLRQYGLDVPSELPEGLHRVAGWLVRASDLRRWAIRLREAVAADAARDALSAGLTRGAAADLVELPSAQLLTPVVRIAKLTEAQGRIRAAGAGHAATLGAAEAGIRELERRLTDAPFRAPEAEELDVLRLGARELAAAERVGRLLRLADAVVVLPTAPARAMRVLAALPQPFTTSEARRALDSSRRVTIPLLELLDHRGWTHRVDASHREVRR